MVNSLLYIFIAQLVLVWLWVIFNKYKAAKKGDQQHEQKTKEDKSHVVGVLKVDHNAEAATNADQDPSPLPPEKTHKDLATMQDKDNKVSGRLLLKQDPNKFFEDLLRRVEGNSCGKFVCTTCGGQALPIIRGLKCTKRKDIFDYLCQIGWDRYHKSPGTKAFNYLGHLFKRLLESQQKEVLLKWEDEILISQDVSMLTFLWFISSEFTKQWGARAAPTELQSHYEDRYDRYVVVDTDVVFDELLKIRLNELKYHSTITHSRHLSWRSKSISFLGHIKFLFQRLSKSQQAEVLLKWEDDVLNDEYSETHFLDFVGFMFAFFETNDLTKSYQLRRQAAHFEVGFKHLVAYKEEFDDCWVPSLFKFNDYNLAIWVNEQRLKKEQITPEQLNRLNELGFVWESDIWERGFKHLVAYKEDFGDCWVPSLFKFNDYNLGIWVNEQRLKKEQITPEQLNRLNELGFVWEIVNWELGYKHLVTYKEDFGDCLVPMSFKSSQFNLGSWVNKQRLKKDKLTTERLDQLSELGFVWGPMGRTNDLHWEDFLKYLVIYKEEFGDCLVPSPFTFNDYDLGSWVNKQRLRKDKLKPQRLESLNELGFVWDISNAQWEDGFKYLATYKEEFGDCLVPISFQSNVYRLGGWVSKQRGQKERLTPERIKRLNDLGFVWQV